MWVRSLDLGNLGGKLRNHYSSKLGPFFQILFVFGYIYCFVVNYKFWWSKKVTKGIHETASAAPPMTVYKSHPNSKVSILDYQNLKKGISWYLTKWSKLVEYDFSIFHPNSLSEITEPITFSHFKQFFNSLLKNKYSIYLWCLLCVAGSGSSKT